MIVRNTFLINGKSIKPGEENAGLYDWIATLSADEQEKYQRAETRQFKHRQDAIDRGDMMIDPQTNDYVWKDNETAKKGKKTDRVWLEFWTRYLTECNIKFESDFKEE